MSTTEDTITIHEVYRAIKAAEEAQQRWSRLYLQIRNGDIAPDEAAARHDEIVGTLLKDLNHA